MRRLREQYPNELAVIGVHSAKFPSEHLTQNIRQAVMRHEIDHPVVNDAGMQIWDAYAVRAWPTLVLVDPRGRIADEISGEILAEDLIPQIDTLLVEDPASLNRTPLALLPEVEMEQPRPLRYPAKLLVAGDRLFVADSGHHRILEVRLDVDGSGGDVIRTFGSGSPGLEDGPAEQASFNQPHGMTLQGSPEDGILYVADTENHAIRRIDLSNGTVRTVAGTGQKAHGNIRLGKPAEVPLRSPWAVLALEQVVFIAMAGSHQIWAMVDEERIGPFAGTGKEALVDGPVAEASFNQPSDLAFGEGYIFIADSEASAIRTIALTAPLKTMTLVGQGLFAFGDVDGVGAQVRLQHPTGLAFARDLVYIADTYNNKIKVLDPYRGATETLIGDNESGNADGAFEETRFYEPEGVQLMDNLLYIADTNNHSIRVADLESRQVMTFDLRGARPPAGERARDVLRLDTAEVLPGEVRIVFDLRLPEGHKLNPEQPSQVYLAEEDPVRARSLTTGDPIGLTVHVDSDQDLLMDLYVYYCQEGDYGLCYVHNREIALPMRVLPDGFNQVTIPYIIERPGA